MRIIFSRKGFDSASGGKPSPIINNVPVSLPIPSGPDEPYRYGELNHPVAGNMGDVVSAHTNGNITRHTHAHADPVLSWEQGPCALGQNGAAAAHLHNQGVDVGDVFVFFGLFASKEHKKHHRIFGMMTVEQICKPGANPKGWKAYGLTTPHPHTDRPHQSPQNTLYIGTGQMAHNAHNALRLSTQTMPSLWQVPPWLTRCGLSYHNNPDRWSHNTLKLVGRGQEFVSHVGDDQEAKNWISHIRTCLAKT